MTDKPRRLAILPELLSAKSNLRGLFSNYPANLAALYMYRGGGGGGGGVGEGGSTGRTLHRALLIHDLIEGQAEGRQSRNSSRDHHLLK